MRHSLCVMALVLACLPALAEARAGSQPALAPSASSAPARIWQIDFLGALGDHRPGGPTSIGRAISGVTFDGARASERQAPRRPVAIEYSDAYQVRRKIHLYASVATLPLFAAQAIVGQKLYGGAASDTMRSAHGVLAGATAALFGVNTVSGAWNLWEARKDPSGRRKRTVHGLLMVAADAGFVLTGLLAPDDDAGERGSLGGGNNRSTHRTVAVTSMAVATASYLMMLLAR